QTMAQPVVVDLRNIYSPEDMAEHGFVYDSVGRAPIQQLRRSTDRDAMAKRPKATKRSVPAPALSPTDEEYAGMLGVCRAPRNRYFTLLVVLTTVALPVPVARPLTVYAF